MWITSGRGAKPNGGPSDGRNDFLRGKGDGEKKKFFQKDGGEKVLLSSTHKTNR